MAPQLAISYPYRRLLGQIGLPEHREQHYLECLARVRRGHGLRGVVCASYGALTMAAGQFEAYNAFRQKLPRVPLHAYIPVDEFWLRLMMAAKLCATEEGSIETHIRRFIHQANVSLLVPTSHGALLLEVARGDLARGIHAMYITLPKFVTNFGYCSVDRTPSRGHFHVSHNHFYSWLSPYVEAFYTSFAEVLGQPITIETRVNNEMTFECEIQPA